MVELYRKKWMALQRLLELTGALVAMTESEDFNPDDERFAELEKAIAEQKSDVDHINERISALEAKPERMLTVDERAEADKYKSFSASLLSRIFEINANGIETVKAKLKVLMGDVRDTKNSIKEINAYLPSYGEDQLSVHFDTKK